MMTYRELKAAQESKTPVFYWPHDDVTLRLPPSGLITRVSIHYSDYSGMTVSVEIAITDQYSTFYRGEASICYKTKLAAMEALLQKWDSIFRANVDYQMRLNPGYAFDGMREVRDSFVADIESERATANAN